MEIHQTSRDRPTTSGGGSGNPNPRSTNKATDTIAHHRSQEGEVTGTRRPPPCPAAPPRTPDQHPSRSPPLPAATLAAARLQHTTAMAGTTPRRDAPPTSCPRLPPQSSPWISHHRSPTSPSPIWENGRADPRPPPRVRRERRKPAASEALIFARARAPAVARKRTGREGTQAAARVSTLAAQGGGRRGGS
jgi:hypothetical protein